MADLGQHFITGIKGTSLLEEEKSFLEKEGVGGVILFSHNYEGPAQLAELVNSIQVLRQEYPLLIAVDHEGGRVTRFKDPFTSFPSMADIALTDSPKICFEIARIMAEELTACGVNVNLAPVCDIVTDPNNKSIGDRSFGSSEEQVSKFITAMIRGLQTHHMISCAKHFPGHGATLKDSHKELPRIKKNRDELEGFELQPFIKAVKARVEMIMLGHLVVEGIDPELPCSLSPKAYELLRQDYKYNKVLLTDDMQMGAITENFTVEEAAVRAIQAGADLLEYRDLEYTQNALEALKKAVKTKKIKNTDLAQKQKRLLELKKAYLKEYRPVYIPDISKHFRKGNVESFIQDLQKKIAEKKARL